MTVTLYLLFPVEATGVTVGYIDVTVRLEDCQLQTPQDTIEQLAAGCLKSATQRVTSNITRGKYKKNLSSSGEWPWHAAIPPQVIVLAEILFDHNTCGCESQRISYSDAASEPEAENMYIYTYQMSHIV